MRTQCPGIWAYGPSISLVAAILLMLAIPAHAVGESHLTPHKAEYKVKVYILSGKLITKVNATDDGYSVRSELHAAGLARLFVRGVVIESSTFSANEDGIRPMIYSSVDKISKEDVYMDFAFDWDAKLATGTINEEEISVPLDGRVHDRVSIQYELMLDLINDRTSEEYTLLDDNKLKRLNVSNIGTKTVKVPFGEFTAVGIQHRKDKSDRITTLWCVEELDYLPVLIEQHRDGKRALRAELATYVPTASE